MVMRASLSGKELSVRIGKKTGMYLRDCLYAEEGPET
jgi:hypothetical protein